MFVGKLDDSFNTREEKSSLRNLYISRAIVALAECIKANLDLVVYQRDCRRRLETVKTLETLLLLFFPLKTLSL